MFKCIKAIGMFVNTFNIHIHLEIEALVKLYNSWAQNFKAIATI